VTLARAPAVLPPRVLCGPPLNAKVAAMGRTAPPQMGRRLPFSWSSRFATLPPPAARYALFFVYTPHFHSFRPFLTQYPPFFAPPRHVFTPPHPVLDACAPFRSVCCFRLSPERSTRETMRFAAGLLLSHPPWRQTCGSARHTKRGRRRQRQRYERMMVCMSRVPVILRTAERPRRRNREQTLQVCDAQEQVVSPPGNLADLNSESSFCQRN